MAAGGLTGAGGGSSSNVTTPPSTPGAGSTFSVSSNISQNANGDGKKPDGKPEQRTGSGQTKSVDQQNQELRHFDALKGRPPLGEGQEGQRQQGHKAIAVAGTAGVMTLGEGAASTATRAGAAIVGGAAGAGTAAVGAAGVVLVGGVLVIPSNSNHDQNVAIPGHEQYRIAGKESEVLREVQIANHDGSWTTIGTVSAGGEQGGPTTFDMSEVNDILKDRGYEPVKLPSTSLPGPPIDGPKGPIILSTPDQGVRTADVTATPNHGPRGAEVLSTPIPEEQGAQILESRNTKADDKLKALGLPTEGEVTFDPQKNQRGNDIRKDRTGQYRDKYDNGWKWNSTQQEWDVKLTPEGKSKYGQLLKGREHLNVSSNGKITH